MRNFTIQKLRWLAVPLLSSMIAFGVLLGFGYSLASAILAGAFLGFPLGLLANAGLWKNRRSETIAPAENLAEAESDYVAQPDERAQSAARDSSHHESSASDDSHALVVSMLDAGRAALLLRPAVASTLADSQRQLAEKQFDDQVALVPAGPVILTGHGAEDLSPADRVRCEHRLALPNFYLDRNLVSNRDFQKFVDDGGYQNLSLWDQPLWPAVLRFVDQTGLSGPKYWKDGTYPEGEDDHPVVGVCWYEATAFARWAGKRLPSDAEWVRAAAWPMEPVAGQTQQLRYPWGDAFEHERANLWHGDQRKVSSVYDYPTGDNPCGIRQLIGNVWEWTSSNFGCWDPPQLRLETDVPMKSIRGGAFDTYFESQAQAQFQSGDSPLARRENIGFRCAASLQDIQWLDETEHELQASHSADALHEDSAHAEVVL